ncbi:MAG: histidinol-phosphatase [Alphaproteobacteria bacterium]|nr:histidinol-phosphatase [Alphaproteobacteria bacterium]MDX5369643.1 histidinol-phosphatase [Alphaproteobacteria bacterium]MDX5464278.1 histidinol-phosphatase [Alphaproteobacteria bacterium]
MPPAITADETAAYLAFADRLADAAQVATLAHFRQQLRTDDKGDGDTGFDPVTAADREAEAAMRRLIEETYPDHGILGEEHGAKPARGPWRWVLDPIDGTKAYIMGLPTWGTLIALEHEGEPVLGLMDQPYVGERFRAANGRGEVIRAGRSTPLASRRCTGLGAAILATTHPDIFAQGREAEAFGRVSRAARMTRFGCDCYNYAMIATGGVDLVIEAALKPMDISPLVPIIRAAGGIVTDWSGGPAATGGQVIAAGDARVHAAALDLLNAA